MQGLLLVLICLVVIVGIILLVIALTEPHKLEYTVYKMTYDDINSDNNDFVPATGSLCGPSDISDNANKLKILFFSDLHAEFCFINPAKITDTIKSSNPDAVIFGGDICNNPKRAQKGINYLNKISSYCIKHSIPFLGVTGNHDVTLSPKQISDCGFELLNGKYTVIKGCAISGVTDSGRKNRVWPDLALVHETEATRHLLVVHNPDYVLNMPKNYSGIPVSGILSGHIHGGQIRTPFNIEFTVLRKDILPKRGIHQGMFKKKGLSLFISRGIGCILMPLRLGSKPEISLIEIDI